MRFSVFTVILLLAFSSPLLFSENVRVKVVDGSGAAVSDATTEVWFLGFTGDDDVKTTGTTDQDGFFSGSGLAKSSIDLIVTKTDFYKSEIKGLSKGKDHEIEVALRKKLSPVSLFAREVKLDIPEFGRPIGFDLTAGDWVAPHGKGRVSDFFIDFNRKFKGMKYSGENLDRALQMSKRAAAARGEVWSEEDFRTRGGKWNAQVEITFQEGGGIVEETENFIPYSELKLPHQAPENGYNRSLELEGSTYGQASEPFVGGYFLRTRVEKQGDKITKSYYSKIYGGFEVDARGRINFMYYFNPTTNDQNLEFDPKANLAVDQRRSFKP